MHSDYGYFEEDKLGKSYDIRMLMRLYPYTRPYRHLLLFAIALVIFITGIDLSIPYLTKIAIDQYIVPQKSGFSPSRVSDADNAGYFLKIDLTDAEAKQIVLENQNLFNMIDKTSATISFDNFSKLKQKDMIVLRKTDIAGVGLIASFFLFIIVINFILNFFQVMLMEYAGQMVMHDLRMHLFSHILNLSVSFFTRNPVARLVTRVANDVQNMYEFFTSVIVFVFKDLFLIVGITAVLVSINWKLALLSFTVLPLVAYASLYFSKQAREVFRTLRVRLAEINSRFSETIGGIKIIQLFNQQANNYQRFAKLNHDNYLAGMDQIKIFAVFMPIIELLSATAVAIVIFYGGKNVISGEITLGVLVAFISYMKMFFNPIRDIAEKYNIMQNAMASAERIFLILDNTDRLQVVTDHKSEIPPTANSQQPTAKIEMKNVSFGYIPGEMVLKEISLKINMGETLAVVGPTGSGKTSLINLIIRFYDATSGKICINGRDIRHWDISELRSKMALVTQDPFLFSGTICDNIFPELQRKKQYSEQEIASILETSNCKSFVSKLPKGIDTELSEGGASVSSGERQLISIARAISRDPDLIILDEATSYIDSETESKIQEALSNLMHNRTAIIVAHRLSTARNANTIIVMNRGRIIESGSHAELMKKKGFYFRLNQL